MTVFTIKRLLQLLSATSIKTYFDDVEFLMYRQLTDKGKPQILRAKKFPVTVAHRISLSVSHLNSIQVILPQNGN
jgi:hypothetical protein